MKDIFLRGVMLTAGTMSFVVPASASESTGSAAAALSAVSEANELLTEDDLKRRGWRIRLGAALGTVPDYVGAQEHRLKLLPVVDIRYGERWHLNFNSLSYSALSSGAWQFGPMVKYKAGRKESRSAVLQGLGDIDPSLQLGAFLKYRTDRMLFRAEYRHALKEEQGDSIRLTLGHALFKAGDFVLAGALRGKWMSNSAMQTHFGITPEQAAASERGLPAYAAQRGVSEVSADIFGRYELAEGYRLVGLVSYTRLLGNAADSPLASGDFGSTRQIKAGIGFTVDF
ncbi:MipA/OmpV family protein [Kordiimonas aestuarii]|uniref:MipA/OmpV family protein n=1 Tax=Kordiimonas aestuarii TaxID=1005925 RepID=UPI0021D11AB1|nr:MipA/OmpV family protein [Kordiimonas aestuarii]